MPSDSHPPTACQRTKSIKPSFTAALSLPLFLSPSLSLSILILFVSFVPSYFFYLYFPRCLLIESLETFLPSSGTGLILRRVGWKDEKKGQISRK